MTQGLGLPWVNGYLQLLDPPGFFDFAAPAVIDDDGLQEYDLPLAGCHEARTAGFVSRVVQQHSW